MANAQKRVAVIGAGIAGLSCAYELTKKGFDVVVYEKNTRPGGRMMTRVSGGLEFNGGALLLSENYRQLKKYSAELGIPWTPLESGTVNRVLRKGKRYPLKLMNALDVLRLSVLPFWTRLKFLWWLIQFAAMRVPGNFFDLNTTPKGMDTGDAASYLADHAGTDVVNYIADPFTAGLHFYCSNELSVAALFTFMKMRLEDKDLSPRYPAGGIQKVPEGLAQQCNVRYGSSVKAVTTIREKNKVSIREGNGEELFDAVVLACPAPIARALLTPPTATQDAMLQSIHYASTIVVAFRVPTDLLKEKIHGVYVPFVESRMISCYLYEGRKGRGLINNGASLLIVYLYDQAARALLKKTDEAIVAAVRDEVLNLCPEAREKKTEIVFHDIQHWEHAMPKFRHGSIETIRNFLEHYQGEDGIYFAGDYLNSPWTEGAARCGVRVAELIKERLR